MKVIGKYYPNAKFYEEKILKHLKNTFDVQSQAIYDSKKISRKVYMF